MAKAIKLRDAGQPLTLTDIESLEKQIGARLPNDYKQFILAFNGGWTDPPTALSWEGRLHSVPTFYPLFRTSDSGLRRAFWELTEINVDEFLPITSTQNNEDICLSLGEQTGSVWLALPNYHNDVRVSVTLVPIAKSFTEFCDMLVEIPEEVCRIEELGEHGTREDLEAYLAEGNSIDEIGVNGQTIIRAAVMYGHLPMVEACLDRGASLFGALHTAVRTGQLTVVKRLIDAGADVNEKDEDGFRPLELNTGTLLVGEEGDRRRALHDLLVSLGAN